MPAKKDALVSFHHFAMPEPNTGCWLWMGRVTKDGYGQFRNTSAHRFAYATFKGPIPAGMEIDHLCRVRCCANPDHLECVTHAENVARGDYLSNHRNARKTHCMRGHPLSGANLTHDRNGDRPARKCRACRNDAQTRRKRAKRKLVEALHGIKISIYPPKRQKPKTKIRARKTSRVTVSTAAA